MYSVYKAFAHKEYKGFYASLCDTNETLYIHGSVSLVIFSRNKIDKSHSTEELIDIIEKLTNIIPISVVIEDFSYYAYKILIIHNNEQFRINSYNDSKLGNTILCMSNDVTYIYENAVCEKIMGLHYSVKVEAMYTLDFEPFTNKHDGIWIFKKLYMVIS